jgi:hypothetical protein
MKKLLSFEIVENKIHMQSSPLVFHAVGLSLLDNLSKMRGALKLYARQTAFHMRLHLARLRGAIRENAQRLRQAILIFGLIWRSPSVCP